MKIYFLISHDSLKWMPNGVKYLRHFFTLKILSHCSEPMREDQFRWWLCPLQSAIRILMTQNLQSEKVSKYKVVDEINFWLLVWNWLIDKTKCFPVPNYCRLVKNDHQLGNWETVKLRVRLRIAKPFYFFFEINVRRSRIRHKRTLNFNDDSIDF